VIQIQIQVLTEKPFLNLKPTDKPKGKKNEKEKEKKEEEEPIIAVL
jgi:hypothetical protein